MAEEIGAVRNPFEWSRASGLMQKHLLDVVRLIEQLVEDEMVRQGLMQKHLLDVVRLIEQLVEDEMVRQGAMMAKLFGDSATRWM
ncbi:hypothetical protein E2562_033240 [Oryza meyeriana var. granulata]|uniref:Uncharacterized protein n=1 Tax=Oryza meyeriana var. granulata TaxID=110450 RepID=A0A6G1BQ11_9ORYZ|nr:hypothetical protein E2562_033240 [Oryza meyeriana var. granulata]